MPYIDLPDPVIVDNRNKVDSVLKKYKEAEMLQDHWKPKYEEAYEYTLPQRQSFYEETPADRRTDKIFDETAVVGIQEFASRLQSGMVPTFARWANLEAGVEIPEENVEEVNQQLDSITSYIFEILGSSNFNQEVHESFMDLAIGTGVMLVEEGDAVNPIKFTAVPLTRVCLNTGPDGAIDSVYRTRYCKPNEIKILYPKAKLPENFDPLRNKNKIKRKIK